MLQKTTIARRRARKDIHLSASENHESGQETTPESGPASGPESERKRVRCEPEPRVEEDVPTLGLSATLAPSARSVLAAGVLDPKKPRPSEFGGAFAAKTLPLEKAGLLLAEFGMPEILQQETPDMEHQPYVDAAFTFLAELPPAVGLSATRKADAHSLYPQKWIHELVDTEFGSCDAQLSSKVGALRFPHFLCEVNSTKTRLCSVAQLILSVWQAVWGIFLSHHCQEPFYALYVDSNVSLFFQARIEIQRPRLPADVELAEGLQEEGPLLGGGLLALGREAHRGDRSAPDSLTVNLALKPLWAGATVCLPPAAQARRPRLLGTPPVLQPAPAPRPLLGSNSPVPSTGSCSGASPSEHSEYQPDEDEEEDEEDEEAEGETEVETDAEPKEDEDETLWQDHKDDEDGEDEAKEETRLGAVKVEKVNSKKGSHKAPTPAQRRRARKRQELEAQQRQLLEDKARFLEDLLRCYPLPFETAVRPVLKGLRAVDLTPLPRGKAEPVVHALPERPGLMEARSLFYCEATKQYAKLVKHTVFKAMRKFYLKIGYTDDECPKVVAKLGILSSNYDLVLMKNYGHDLSQLSFPPGELPAVARALVRRVLDLASLDLAHNDIRPQNFCLYRGGLTLIDFDRVSSLGADKPIYLDSPSTPCVCRPAPAFLRLAFVAVFHAFGRHAPLPLHDAGLAPTSHAMHSPLELPATGALPQRVSVRYRALSFAVAPPSALLALRAPPTVLPPPVPLCSHLPAVLRSLARQPGWPCWREDPSSRRPDKIVLLPFDITHSHTRQPAVRRAGGLVLHQTALCLLTLADPKFRLAKPYVIRLPQEQDLDKDQDLDSLIRQLTPEGYEKFDKRAALETLRGLCRPSLRRPPGHHPSPVAPPAAERALYADQPAVEELPDPATVEGDKAERSRSRRGEGTQRPKPRARPSERKLHQPRPKGPEGLGGGRR
ncbi:hypothetical protein PAPYR_7027 [Paratrimastix pyriformis]|uniref:Protein kinase domain-containing protein n=1 Tax=Paratrimastix pyriformis TaxID=342808 RepID=A0ABQ8UGZ6_9EUKA|nr:hypothetical protein PAPYR_7027 [Paratrimastix pyriformis]